MVWLSFYRSCALWDSAEISAKNDAAIQNYWDELRRSWTNSSQRFALKRASVTPLCKLRLNNNKTSQFGFLLSVLNKRSACLDLAGIVMASKNHPTHTLPSQQWHYLIHQKKCCLSAKSTSSLWIIFHTIEKIPKDGKTVWGTTCHSTIVSSRFPGDLTDLAREPIGLYIQKPSPCLKMAVYLEGKKRLLIKNDFWNEMFCFCNATKV